LPHAILSACWAKREMKDRGLSRAAFRMRHSSDQGGCTHLARHYVS
jgi:hypothetical protein